MRTLLCLLCLLNVPGLALPDAIGTRARAHSDRLVSLHLKDITASGVYTCPGMNTLDIIAVVAAARTAEIPYLTLEVDQIEDGMACAQRFMDLVA